MYYSNAYCTKKDFHSKSSSPGGNFGIFFGLFCGIFLFLENRLVSYYIFYNTLLVVRLNSFIGFFCFLFGAIFSIVLFLRGGGGHFQYFSLFLKKSLVCFHELLLIYSWYYPGNPIKSNMACYLRFARLF